MEQLSFRPVTAPEAVLARYEICRTRDIEVARQCGEKIFCENHLCNLDARTSLDASIFYRRAGGSASAE